MKNFRLLYCLVAIFVSTLAGCQNDKIFLEIKGSNGSLIPPDTLVSISSTETLGQWFTLDISADGEVVYTPTKYNGYNRENLPPQGVPVKSRISREQMDEILREFENQKFFTLKDEYEQGSGECEDSRILDAGNRTISIEIGGRKKTVKWKACQKNGEDFPTAFFTIFEKIDEVRNRNK